jgi:hypothetical protein
MTRAEASSNLYDAAYRVIEAGDDKRHLDRVALAFTLAYMQERDDR